ncbi:MAG: hypothetical protein JWN67_3006 [Actinomycetia bacterium]|nr:hypothetical protein [Actinomycetes bacterium]
MPPTPPPQDWMGPPEGWLGGYVPLRVELARAPGTIVLLGPLEAFPTGVRFELQIHSREPSHGPGIGPMGPLGDDARIGVAYSDGSKWQGHQDPFDPLRPPKAPNVAFNSGGGGGNHWSHRLWLWPLPPPGPVTFALAAPSIGIAETTTSVEGEVLRAAAAEAEQLWEPLTPEEQQAHQRAAIARMQAMRPGISGVLRVQATRPDPPEEG